MLALRQREFVRQLARSLKDPWEPDFPGKFRNDLRELAGKRPFALPFAAAGGLAAGTRWPLNLSLIGR